MAEWYAEMRVQQQRWKRIRAYVDLGARYVLEPIAIETLGVFSALDRRLLNYLNGLLCMYVSFFLNTVKGMEISFL